MNRSGLLRRPRDALATIEPKAQPGAPTKPKQTQKKTEKDKKKREKKARKKQPTPPSNVLSSAAAPASPVPQPLPPTLPALPPAIPKRFAVLNADVTKAWLLEHFEFDQSVDVYRNAIIDCLFRRWLRENVEGDVWKKELHELASSVGKNARQVFAQAAQLVGANPPRIGDNGRKQQKILRNVRPKPDTLEIMKEYFPTVRLVNERP